MKKYTYEDTIYITMWLYPIIYGYSEIVAAVSFDPVQKKFHTDTPYRPINGPLSQPGEELSGPVQQEWDNFIDDCKWLINELGFTIISSNRSVESKKSEYILMFGMKDDPCGRIVFDLRLSDHPFDATFPEELKAKALEYLTMKNILDGTASDACIDFQVEKVTVGDVVDDSWDRAFNRVFLKLKQMRRRVRSQLNITRSNNRK